MRGSGPLDTARTAALARVAERRRVIRITRHGELVIQRVEPAITMGRARVVLPPGSFLQATATGEATLAELVIRHAGKAKIVSDLFCGVGPFALRLAAQARVTAVDSDEAALDAVNDSAFGLQAGIFTSSIQTAFLAHQRLQVGGVIVGDVPSFRADQMPYGGIKHSGMGKEGPKYAVREMTEEKMVVLHLRG